MKIGDKERLTKHCDTSPEAVRWRLRAAIKSTSRAQNVLASEAGIKATTLNSQIAAGRPSVEFMEFLYKNFRIDFNFILHGDFSQLPGDVANALLGALDALERSKSSRDS